MFKFGFNPGKDKNSVEYIVEKIKSGDTDLKEEFIKDNILYITKLVSNIVGAYVDNKNSEEFSIGLLAFNEAIDNYDYKRNGDFYKYSYMVIKHRIIDNIRKNKRHQNNLLFSSIEDDYDFSNRYMVSNSHYQFENIELAEEIDLFEKCLSDYEISLGDLVSSSPKHKDSRMLSIKIARTLAEDEELYQKMIRKKCIPLSDLLKKIQASKKTVVRNRKFIIAVSLILRSRLDDLKEFVVNMEKREKYE
ncbi:RNA polymerase sigma-I factor [Pseudobacteroides cellulosolvens]|uniref:RNA polymerase sigma factor SigI n=1 Tax=Pseudobacteroides cellulosolvens ATCC 35603 = DSM 2933 TaxID=398512 RepID=A0A0L6JY13_9FIRM|nr:RNA polymerase sigma-I factor [Pseudobacteroides cellulosolvens]KNY30342.1 RNA polymerase, sigma 28 subunit, SigI [Pseudobacteroides cellulosolvens ATCC 35603 = DSM 2933]